MVRKMEPSSLQSDMLYILSYFTYDLYMFSEYLYALWSVFSYIINLGTHWRKVMIMEFLETF